MILFLAAAEGRGGGGRPPPVGGGRAPFMVTRFGRARLTRVGGPPRVLRGGGIECRLDLDEGAPPWEDDGVLLGVVAFSLCAKDNKAEPWRLSVLTSSALEVADFSNWLATDSPPSIVS